jgi:hypothetical protein
VLHRDVKAEAVVAISDVVVIAFSWRHDAMTRAQDILAVPIATIIAIIGDFWVCARSAHSPFVPPSTPEDGPKLTLLSFLFL